MQAIGAFLLNPAQGFAFEHRIRDVEMRAKHLSKIRGFRVPRLINTSLPRSNHVLHRAVLDRDEDEIRGCPDEDSSDDDFWEALYCAVESGYGNAVQLLLARRPTLVFNQNECTPLHHAALAGSEEVCCLLLQFSAELANHSDDGGSTPLFYASGNVAVVQMLLSAGAELHHTNNADDTPFGIACSHGDLAAVEAMINAGANLETQNDKGFTPLMLASQIPQNSTDIAAAAQDPRDDVRGYLEVVRLLLCSGASLNVRNPRTGETVLHQVVRGWKADILLDAFIEAGCDLETRCRHNQTPLIHAIQAIQPEAVSKLLQANCQVDYSLAVSGVACTRAGCASCEFVTTFGNIGYTPFHLTYLLCEKLASCNGMGSQFFAQRPNSDWDAASKLLRIMRVLASAGAIISVPADSSGMDDLAKCAYFLECCGYGHDPRKTVQMFTDVISGPRTLAVLTREKIRTYLGRDLAAKLKKLIIPESLRKFVLYRDAHELYLI